MRLKLTLAYDGAAFRGWQSQTGGGAVQDVLQETLTRLAGGHKVHVHGSGRTDAGVHALGQVAHADVPDQRPEPAFWQRALNATLAPSIRVMSCTRAKDDFHARYSATGKIYDYLLWTGPVLPPHWAARAWHVVPPAGPAALRRAAKILAGRHDFRGFAANRGTPVKDARRHLRRISVSGRGPVIRLRFEGDGFLYRMVRMLAAAMVRVAQGKATEADLRARLAGRETDLPRIVAPSDGLYLVRVAYARAGAQSG
ncbi:MAG: tRNA pseudouridine(38-40) synthase TruA [Verrucomicrobia bacterium]|jgi:tRNA pseudouridine38-40 synthase|nr:tRNA pseudouridine(38-40) synthase TruA [Verrucomicrobiota bacterium]MDA1202982.1 tRNA pseudouridine(38-40) synthase TruA [Verrucomicrobiota bacterium]